MVHCWHVFKVSMCLFLPLNIFRIIVNVIKFREKYKLFNLPLRIKSKLILYLLRIYIYIYIYIYPLSSYCSWILQVLHQNYKGKLQ